jgi:CBS domain-containing protein
MNASELMTPAVQTCGEGADLQRVAQLMWEADCGVVPVVDADGRVIGIITDRDIAMAAYLQGRPLSQIPVTSAMAKQVRGVREGDALEVVEALMRGAQVRRVPVLDGEGRLRGILSLNDLARHAHRPAWILGFKLGRKGDGLSNDSVVGTLAAICQPRAEREPAAKGAARLSA